MRTGYVFLAALIGSAAVGGCSPSAEQSPAAELAPSHTAPSRPSSTQRQTPSAEPPAEAGASTQARATVRAIHFTEAGNRAVIELQDVVGRPRWRASYAGAEPDHPFAVDLPGAAVLVVEISPVPYPAHLLGGNGEAPEVTVGSPPEGSAFTAAETGGPYEGKYYVFLGLVTETDVTVTYDEGEEAVVVDVRGS